jgi:4-hydroxy-3-methylbut-2-enyl diphosphate reductase
LQKFAKEHDVVIFVSGKKSSNGKALYSVCKAENERSYFVENESEIEADWFGAGDKVGICGATSTPMWLMQRVAAHIEGCRCSKLREGTQICDFCCIAERAFFVI